MTQFIQSIQSRRTLPTVVGLMLVALFSAVGVGMYQSSQVLADSSTSVQELQKPDVEVETLKYQPLRLWTDYSGRLQAVHHVEVRPQVGGSIQQVLFDEGELVEKGKLLYIIDPRPYQAALDSAQAELNSALSKASLATLEFERATGLLKKKVISQSLFDARNSDLKVANARISIAKAAVTQAALDLEYAHIKAPVTGRISRAEITIGNVIEAGPNAPVLTTIVSTDKLYIEFDVDEQTYVQMVRDVRAKQVMPVELSLTGDGETTYRGTIHSFDNHLDTRSATIRARAIVNNQDGVLVPGMYANVRLGSANESDVLLIKQQAIGTDQDKKFVLVVDDQGVVSYRQIVLGPQIGEQRLVVNGLNPGDQVIVNSIQRVRAGMPVNPVETLTL